VTEGDTATFDCSFIGTPYPHTRIGWLSKQQPINVSLLHNHRTRIYYFVFLAACSICEYYDKSLMCGVFGVSLYIWRI